MELFSNILIRVLLKYMDSFVYMKILNIAF